MAFISRRGRFFVDIPYCIALRVKFFSEISAEYLFFLNEPVSKALNLIDKSILYSQILKKFGEAWKAMFCKKNICYVQHHQ